MRTLIVAGFVFAPAAIAADFRGTEFGSPCAAIEEREKALGSEPIPANLSKGPGYRFNGRAFDRDVLIVYLCKDGALALGHLQFPYGTYDEAVVNYLTAYNFFLSVYGAPFIAYARHRDKTSTDLAIPKVGDATRDTYYASWIAEGLSTYIALMARRDQAGDNWFVMAVTSPAGE